MRLIIYIYDKMLQVNGAKQYSIRYHLNRESCMFSVTLD